MNIALDRTGRPLDAAPGAWVSVLVALAAVLIVLAAMPAGAGAAEAVARFGMC